jgi:hypothetical protein
MLRNVTLACAAHGPLRRDPAAVRKLPRLRSAFQADRASSKIQSGPAAVRRASCHSAWRSPGHIFSRRRRFHHRRDPHPFILTAARRPPTCYSKISIEPGDGLSTAATLTVAGGSGMVVRRMIGDAGDRPRARSSNSSPPPSEQEHARGQAFCDGCDLGHSCGLHFPFTIYRARSSITYKPSNGRTEPGRIDTAMALVLAGCALTHSDDAAATRQTGRSSRNVESSECA